MNKFSENSALVSELVKIPIFSALGKDQLESVLSTIKRIQLEQGEILFEQGQFAKDFYMVHQGQVQLSRLSNDGHEKVIDILHTGQIFAEAVMFMEDRRYPVNAMALKSSKIISFDIETFINLLRDSVDTCFRMMADMSQRLHVQLNEIDSLSLHNATYRLVHYLLKSIPSNEAELAEVILNYPKNILASRLSIKPETFSRIMAQLKRDNIIDVSGNKVIIRDIAGLQKLVRTEFDN